MLGPFVTLVFVNPKVSPGCLRTSSKAMKPEVVPGVDRDSKGRH